MSFGGGGSFGGGSLGGGSSFGGGSMYGGDMGDVNMPRRASFGGGGGVGGVEQRRNSMSQIQAVQMSKRDQDALVDMIQARRNAGKRMIMMTVLGVVAVTSIIIAVSVMQRLSSLQAKVDMLERRQQAQGGTAGPTAPTPAPTPIQTGSCDMNCMEIAVNNLGTSFNALEARANLLENRLDNHDQLIALKADTSAMNSALAGKADSSHSHASNSWFTSALSGKADATSLSVYATTSALSAGLAGKADASSLSAYATTTALTSGLAGKLNTNAWPTGTYCILKKGACPAGFSALSGHVRAMSGYSTTAAYYGCANIGDSYVGAHGGCTFPYGGLADVAIQACCK